MISSMAFDLTNILILDSKNTVHVILDIKKYLNI